MTKQAIDVDANGMSGEFGPQPCTQAPEGVRVVGLNGHLLNQLTIDPLVYRTE